MNGLTFEELRKANLARCNGTFHPPPGSIYDWTPTDWATAMAGECGEACNIVKKIRRLETAPHWSPEDMKTDLVGMLADELADLLIYTDLLAARLSIDLEAAVVRKFDATSRKVGSHIRLGDDQ